MTTGWVVGVGLETALLALLIGVPGSLAVILHDQFLSDGTVSTFCTFYIVLSASILAYRISPWHPLARYPGPLPCKLSKFWMAYVAMRTKKQHLYIRGLHDQYGDVVRIGSS